MIKNIWLKGYSIFMVVVFGYGLIKLYNQLENMPFDLG